MDTQPIQIQIHVNPLVATQLPEHEFVTLARKADHLGIETPELLRRIVLGWLEGQTLFGEGDPVTLQSAGHPGYVP